MPVASRNCYNKLFPDLWEVSGKVRGKCGVYASQRSLLFFGNKRMDDLGNEIISGL